MNKAVLITAFALLYVSKINGLEKYQVLPFLFRVERSQGFPIDDANELDRKPENVGNEVILEKF